MAASKYFEGSDRTRPTPALVRAQKRRKLVTAAAERRPPSRTSDADAPGDIQRERRQREEETHLTEMEKQVVALRRAHPDKLLLFECGYRMRIFAEDAERAVEVLGIRAGQPRHMLETSVPVHRALHHSRRLARAGFKVGIVRQVDSAAARAVSFSSAEQRKPLDRSESIGDVYQIYVLKICGSGGRCVANVYTWATIPAEDASDDEAACSQDSIGDSRFIACVVEQTVHSTTLFVRLVHCMDEADRQHHVRVHRHSQPICLATLTRCSFSCMMPTTIVRARPTMLASVFSRTTCTLAIPCSRSSRTVRP